MSRSAWALVIAFVLSLPAVTSRLYASDEIEYYSYLRSVWFDRDLSFENEYRYFLDHHIARGPGFKETFLDLSTPTGLKHNFGTIGSAILWAPMYGVADVGVRIARAFGAQVTADGYSRPYIAAVAYGSALYGFLAVLLSALMARRLVGHGTAAAALVWLGTPLPFYMYLAPGMAHATSVFAVTCFIALWLRVRREWSVGRMAALGAMAALVTMVREQDAFYVSGVALDFLLWLFEDRARRGERVVSGIKGGVAGAAAFAVAFIPQAWAYLTLNGHLGPSQVIANKMYWSSPHAGQVLFSAEHGLFAWTPLACVAVAGLVALGAARPHRGPTPSDGTADSRRVALCLLVMFLAQVYISGSVDTWTVAGSFGQRRFVGASAALVIGLAALLSLARGWPRRVLAGVIVLAVWWNLGMMVQFGAGMMDRQRLELGKNAYNTYVRVPLGLPRIVYRYFFDRASFYKPA